MASLSLREHRLRIVGRPGDGSCGFWSVGTGYGDYAVDAFDLLQDGRMRSPLDMPHHPRAVPLIEQLHADRAAVAGFIEDPANAYTLRAECDLWTDPDALQRHRDKRIGPEWQPPRRTRIDRAKVEQYRSDNRHGWMNPPCMKA